MFLSNWNFFYIDIQYYVYESNKWENRMGYLWIFLCFFVFDGDYGVYVMDCEMVGLVLIISIQICVLGQNFIYIYIDILFENF